MSPSDYNLKGFINNNIIVALTHIENAYNALKYALDNEKESHPTQLNDLYTYGLDTADFHKIKLYNIKKSILSIIEPRQYRKENHHAMPEMSISSFPCSEDLV